MGDVPDIGEQFGVARRPRGGEQRDVRTADPRQSLPLTLEYVRTLTDDTGMIQHGIGGVPDPHTGYTTDDNARALVAMVRLWRRLPERRTEIEPLLRIYVRFLLWAQCRGGEDAGRFINFFAYDRRPLDERGTEDCLGRCIWALAEADAGDLPTGVHLSVRRMLDYTRPHLADLRSPHAVAYALAGLCQRPDAARDADVRRGADYLAWRWRESAAPGWHWFEPQMTYDNARCVEGMLRVAAVTGDPQYQRVAVDALHFLTEHSFDPQEGCLTPVGNRGWWFRGRERTGFDQQTIEAGAYAELFRFAADYLGDPGWADLAERSREWFVGYNVHRLPLYDYDTGACYDALTAEGVNLNQGAESVLSYLLAESITTSQ